MTTSWRDQADQVIRRVVAAHPNATEKQLRLALQKAYPFGTRSNWPYKVWLSQTRRYLDARFPERTLPTQHSHNFLPLFRHAAKEKS